MHLLQGQARVGLPVVLHKIQDGKLPHQVRLGLRG